jgi:hypothetical protein
MNFIPARLLVPYDAGRGAYGAKGWEMPNKHHYVSQFHLRHFVDLDTVNTRDPWVWVGDVATKTVKKRAPKNLAWARGMFDGPGGIADRDAKLEDLLAAIESAAARSLSMFTKAAPGSRGALPLPLMRYVAWAAARNLPMAMLFRRWATDHDCGQMVEAPPPGLEKIRRRSRTHTMEHDEFGIKENVPSDEAVAMMEGAWTPKLDRDDLLELMHLQQWYFQVRFFPRLQWIILDAPEDCWFIIADRPVVWGFNEDVTCKPALLRHPNIQLFAPLTRSVALFAHHAEGSFPGEIVPRDVNRAMAAAAVEWIAGSDEATVRGALESRA